ncbi:interleukin-like EMT inducer domain-containing protein [Hymenobacter sp. BRD67]|uniref:interleukin-like EMT inducer domain-containing protein n=1 Tax=Hymenobacter sp. BRD67 TaxID=2675877 RepID=UPI0015658725|nr:interleukin-like EMT inducer domain-containing protein [Hymenobacter sp. BRD67]QKG51978.1 hypothetical protein GKZ67_04330 [Hymenobacter sp. BRD67]
MPTFNIKSGYGIITDPLQPPGIDCAIQSPNLIIAVLDEHSLQRLNITQGGPYLTCGLPNQLFYHFAVNGDTLDNLNNSAVRQNQLKTFLSNVPDGAYVAIISINRLRYASLLPILGSSFSTLLGSKLITQLKNGDPWALVAQKRASGGRLIQEAGPDRTQPLPAYSQGVEFTTQLTTPGQSGTITSTLIGPAQQWQTLFNVIKPVTPTAHYTLQLVGIDASNKATVLNANVKTKNLDLTGYSATTYPYMQLQLSLRDSVNRVPPQLRQWLITYKGVPEGVVRRDLVAAIKYDSTTLRNQAATGKLNFPVRFDNVSSDAFANPLQLQVELLNATTGLPVASTKKLIPFPHVPAPYDTATVNVTMDVTGVFGHLIPHIFVNPQLQPELYYFNNELRLNAFTVRDNSVPPTLDVAFDGRHILDGELVSSRPVIDIQLKDADKLRLIKDASAFTLFLQKDGQTAVPVDVNGASVQFSVDVSSGSLAKLEYRPGLSKPLDDGLYTLRVQGRNASNSAAGTQDYQVRFQVIGASMISNVFPYPNPVTSKAKFVFTLTGNELPRNMKIQIMTLTGRVVREIFMSELGSLHIGNNVTDYAWDGTDQYGDRLANGTYLYRVSIDDPTGEYKKFSTAGDQAFKNDWGKLVLLR